MKIIKTDVQNKARGFTKVDNEFVRCPEVSHTGFRLFVLLRSYSNGHRYPSYRVINHYTGMADDTITKGLKELQSYNMISYVQGSRSRANRYSILPEEQWRLPQRLGNHSPRGTEVGNDETSNFQRVAPQKPKQESPQKVGHNKINTGNNNERKIKEKKDVFNFLSSEQLNRLKIALSKSGESAISSTSSEVTKLFRSIGKNSLVFQEIENLIQGQFQRNEKTQKLGVAVLMAAKTAYKDAVKSHDSDKFRSELERQRLAEKEKRDNCPTKTDEICREIMLLLGGKCCDTGRGPWEYGVSDNDLQYFLDCNVKYWGESKTRSLYSEIYAHLEKTPRLIDDEDDDDLPPMRLKRKSKSENILSPRNGITK